jgi:hypothetical protein
LLEDKTTNARPANVFSWSASYDAEELDACQPACAARGLQPTRRQ